MFIPTLKIQDDQFKQTHIIPWKWMGPLFCRYTGCLEHTFALFEAFRDAKESHRQIIITWLDLANAYGSVRHNLIQFALNWFHIPKLIQNIIFDYYEKICAFVKTKNWTTGFCLFDIGLFQGCVLSTIIFYCVFQLLLDFLHPKTNLNTISSQLLQYPLLLKPMPMT